MEKSAISKLQTQIEYYLSDENLKKDSFFHDVLSQKHEIPLEMILKCNNIKKLSVTEENIKEALESSIQVEFDSKSKSFKRKSKEPLPELLAIKKKVKKEENKIEEQKDQPTEPKAYKLTTKDEYVDKITWRVVEDNIKANLSINPLFISFNKDEGNGFLVVDEKTCEKFENGKIFKIENLNYEINELSNEESEKFWAKNKKMFEISIGNKNKKFKKSNKKDMNNNSSIFNNNANQMKTIFKKIINETKNGEVIEEPNKTMLMDLLQFHENKEKKLKNFHHFTVNDHPEHEDSRCFFVVRTDGETEDFSLAKCINNIKNK